MGSKYHYSIYKQGNKHHGCSGCLFKLLLVPLLIIGLICYSLYKVSPDGFGRLSKDALNKVQNAINDDSVENSSNQTEIGDTIKIKPTINISTENKGDTTQTIKVKGKVKMSIPIEIRDNKMIYMDAKLNGVPMKFILDTGCSDVQISSAEYLYLKHNNLISDDDYSNNVISVDANGKETECPVFKIKNFKVGGVTLHNVECSVNENGDAPLLLGQTVLSNLGNITVDYNGKQILIN